ncbi:TetR/AcrR family transcriptional regulator [Leifsonia sp. C5G2]|uniref:TetR/AcrR family transcriptional regulator n=1 Tax=Leifsonia sp. C5G2 TaxID=2735269 RepID=UPI001584F05F|nr:TetR/AcrR family transcriptional regulator [Leifsonia sp. C5G2]NUU07626.1 TetR/AcrR family transcriptional regulator [Leifsonia sp. C5G2]
MPKVIDHDQRRSDIIDVTWGLIVKGGLEAATMREIAAEAGFANGALKHYFPGKDEIIQGTYDRALGMMSSTVESAVDGKTGLEALKAIVYASAPTTPESITAGRVLLSFWERALSNQDLHASYRTHLVSWRTGLASYLAQGRADGDIVTDTPDEQLVDEIVLINAGANIMSLLAPELSTPELLTAQLDAFFDRITRR